MNPDNAIEIRNMYKSFKIQSDRAASVKDLLLLRRNNKVQRHLVLNDINLDIKKGDTVCLIGSNGSGKSTLLKLMTRIIYPTSGEIKTDGKKIEKGKNRQKQSKAHNHLIIKQIKAV